MYSYLLNRCGNYHFRIRVPADLTQIIHAEELWKSPKTRDPNQAKIAALPYLQNITKTFSLYRHGFITDDQVRQSIDSVLGRSMKTTTNRNHNLSVFSLEPDPSAAVPFRLSAAISQFISDKKQVTFNLS